ncbi:hypothetical protein [Hydrogenovibrio marinus]|uniref:Uncharacterized protein n=1 Tax=Hydrogenovibrio marinus TaxID=28885 RepID=A0A067A2L2_HYDMR|nr:hypothetical protein [Hydrogenovibrio marinus]KDN96866.1 hypothetical protein EI16_11570 [Hydrogenovibrio marinus]BBN59125.1 hypothetical protein HVMH_0719 [Hydrogenovibrio marinus]
MEALKKTAETMIKEDQSTGLVAKFKTAWTELEIYQKVFLIFVLIAFPLGLIFPPVMEILLLPFAFVTCSG